MGARKENRAITSGSNQLTIDGSFIPNGSSAIATKYGYGFSVAYKSTGVWTVTLDDVFKDFISLGAWGQFATSESDAHQYLIGDISIPNRTFDIKHVGSTDVSGTDLAAANISTSGTANKVNFRAVVALARVPGAGVP